MLANPQGHLPNVRQDEFSLVKFEIINDPAGVGYPTWPTVEEEKLPAAEQIAQLLVRRPKVPNSQPAPKIRKPMDPDVLFQTLTPEEIRALPVDTFEMIHAAIESQDHSRVKRLLNIALAKGWLSQAKYEIILTEVDALIDDPNHPAEVLGDSRLMTVLGRKIGGISPNEIRYIMENT